MNILYGLIRQYLLKKRYFLSIDANILLKSMISLAIDQEIYNDAKIQSRVIQEELGKKKLHF